MLSAAPVSGLVINTSSDTRVDGCMPVSVVDCAVDRWEEDGAAIAAAETGTDDYITKPFVVHEETDPAIPKAVIRPSSLCFKYPSDDE